MRLIDRWSALVDPRPVATTRIAVGIGALVKLLVVAPTFFALATPGAVHVPWIDGFAPVLATPWAPFAATAVWAAAASAFAAGIRTRLAGSILAAVALATMLSDRQLYANHLYLLVLLVALLVIADAGAARSFDAAARPRPVRNLGPDLIRIQVTIVYAFAALWKINVHFLSGFMIGSSLQGGFFALPAALATPEVFAALAVLTIALELFVPFGLWSPRLRPLAAAIGVALHISFAILIAQWDELLVFGILMLATYPLFFALDTPHEPSPDPLP